MLRCSSLVEEWRSGEAGLNDSSVRRFGEKDAVWVFSGSHMDTSDAVSSDWRSWL